MIHRIIILVASVLMSAALSSFGQLVMGPSTNVSVTVAQPATMMTWMQVSNVWKHYATNSTASYVDGVPATFTATPWTLGAGTQVVGNAAGTWDAVRGYTNSVSSNQLAHYILNTAQRYGRYDLANSTSLLAIAESWDYSAGNTNCVLALDMENVGVADGVAVGRLWTPADTTTAVWLDYSDATSLTVSTNLISQVSDKSGGGFHFTATTTARPTLTNAINGLSVARYDGNDTMIAADASNWKYLHSGTTRYRIWIVSQSSSTNDLQTLFGTVPWDSGTYGAAIIARPPVSSRLHVRGGRTVGGAYWGASEPDNSYATNRVNMIGVEYDWTNATATNRITIRLDAGAPWRDNTLTNAPVNENPANAARIGSETGSGGVRRYFTGDIAEIIIIQGVPDSATDDRVWGYLAHKWGLTANLPADHPYKSAAPVTGSGPGFILDRSTYGNNGTASGSPIHQTPDRALSWEMLNLPVPAFFYTGSGNVTNYGSFGSYTLTKYGTTTIDTNGFHFATSDDNHLRGPAGGHGWRLQGGTSATFMAWCRPVNGAMLSPAQWIGCVFGDSSMYVQSIGYAPATTATNGGWGGWVYNNSSVAIAFSAARPTLSTGIWEHVAWVVDGSDKTLKVYRDGSLASSVVRTNLTSFTLNWGSTAILGTSSGSSEADRKYRGSVDYVRVYNTTARTPREIYLLYLSDGKAKGLISP